MVQQPRRGKRGNPLPPKPQKKKQPTRDKYNKVVIAPRRIPAGLSRNHHFDAFSPGKPQAMAFAIGPATHVNGARRFTVDIPNSVESTHTIARFQPGGGFNQWVTTTLSLPTDPADPSVWSPVTNVTINSTGILSDGTFTATNPTHVMCSRGSLRVRNMTRSLNVAGSAQILRRSVPLTGLIDFQTLYNDVKDLIEESTATVVMTGMELTRSHQWDCIPVSQAAYTSFNEPVSGEVERLDPGLSSVFILFEHGQQPQQYEVSMAACYYARYNIVGPLSNMGKAPPVAPLSLINSIRTAAEHVGSFGRPLAASVAGGIAEALEQRAGAYLASAGAQRAGAYLGTAGMLALTA